MVVWLVGGRWLVGWLVGWLELLILIILLLLLLLGFFLNIYSVKLVFCLKVEFYRGGSAIDRATLSSFDESPATLGAVSQALNYHQSLLFSPSEFCGNVYRIQQNSSGCGCVLGICMALIRSHSQWHPNPNL